MGELVLVVEAALLPSALETGNVTIELGDPVGGLSVTQVVVAPLLGEVTELGKTLKGVSWWDLLVIS